MNIVLLRPDRAGDALKSLPAIRALIQGRGMYRVTILCSRHNASIFQFEPGLDVIDLPARWDEMDAVALGAALDPVLKGRQWDLALNLLTDPRDAVDRLVDVLPAAEKRSVGNSRGYEPLSLSPAGVDERKNIQKLIEMALSTRLDLDLTCSPIAGPDDQKEAESVLGSAVNRILGVCPLASMANRSQKPESWRRWLSVLLSSGEWEEVALFGSADQHDRLQAFVPDRNARLCFPSSFRAMAAYLARMAAVVATDSGPLHLARALGKPVLGLLSNADRARWYPGNGPHERLVQKGLLGRHPSVLELRYHYRRWQATLP